MLIAKTLVAVAEAALGGRVSAEARQNAWTRFLSGASAGADSAQIPAPIICHSPQPHLDRVHTVFGQVREGMNVVNDIKQNDVINSIRVS